MTPVQVEPTVPAREMHRFVVPSLFASVLLCSPVGAVLAVLALVGIVRSKGHKTGAFLASVAFFLSAILVPAVLVSALYGNPKILDACYYTQEEAVGLLRIISYSQENFHKVEGRYGSLEEIGWEPKVRLGPYDYMVERFDKDQFLAVARGKEIMDGDVLIIDESRRVVRALDICVIRRQERR